MRKQTLNNRDENPQIEAKRSVRVLDLFCGAGGFSEGFRQQGFDIVCGADNWGPANETFNFNFDLKSSRIDLAVISLTPESIYQLPDVEIIVGSPPCVSFSSSNRSGKSDKTLGVQLIEAFLRIVT
ncbi:MAG TPA: DNA cytosine methyltransferase, partial [Candidatus Kapabacteria bacterium]|nr:DNA cytosine methyltransferase [Candidatus Kapabacteria bacterium]